MFWVLYVLGGCITWPKRGFNKVPMSYLQKAQSGSTDTLMAGLEHIVGQSRFLKGKTDEELEAELAVAGLAFSMIVVLHCYAVKRFHKLILSSWRGVETCSDQR